MKNRCQAKRRRNLGVVRVTLPLALSVRTIVFDWLNMYNVFSIQMHKGESMRKKRRQKIHRTSFRMQGYDYSLPGGYFVTINVLNKKPLLGKVLGCKVFLSAYGEIVKEEWLRTEIVRPFVTLDEFIIIPNHIHGIIFINEKDVSHESVCRNAIVAATRRVAATGSPRGPQPDSLGSIIGGYKSASTKRINRLRSTPGESFWQKNFYDRIIRNKRELNSIRRYIKYNPYLWRI